MLFALCAKAATSLIFDIVLPDFIDAIVLPDFIDAILSSLVKLLSREGSLQSEMEEIEKNAVRQKGLRLRKSCTNTQNSDAVLKGDSGRVRASRRLVPATKLGQAFTSLSTYGTLCEQVEALRSENYDCANHAHKEMLLQLWRLLRVDDHISSCYGAHWRTIGFQSDDPSRDFRGMGILSLEQLIYMAKFEPRSMRSILVLSNHPKIGFPLAITAINMTSLCYHLLKEGLLKNHFRNSLENVVQIEDFHNVYCRVFILFTEFWKKMDPPSLMNFNNIRMRFEEVLFPLLKEESSRLGCIEI